MWHACVLERIYAYHHCTHPLRSQNGVGWTFQSKVLVAKIWEAKPGPILRHCCGGCGLQPGGSDSSLANHTRCLAAGKPTLEFFSRCRNASKVCGRTWRLCPKSTWSSSSLGFSTWSFCLCLFGQLVGRKFHCQVLPVSVLWCTAEPQWACGIEATTGSFVCFLGPGCPVNRVGYENHNEASCIPMGPALLWFVWT